MREIGLVLGGSGGCVSLYSAPQVELILGKAWRAARPPPETQGSLCRRAEGRLGLFHHLQTPGFSSGLDYSREGAATGGELASKAKGGCNEIQASLL